MSKLGEQLREYREKRNLSQRQLSLATGVEQATISRIELGHMSLVSPHLSKLADYLGIEILNPLGVNVEPVSLEGVLLPIWSQANAGRLAFASAAVKERETTRHMMSAKKVTPRVSYAMEIIDDSMMPRFRRGDIVVIDPTVKPEVGRFVVAQRESQDQAIFAQYAARGQDSAGNAVFELVPMNPLYDSVRSDQVSLRISGVAVQKVETDL